MQYQVESIINSLRIQAGVQPQSPPIENRYFEKHLIIKVQLTVQDGLARPYNFQKESHCNDEFFTSSAYLYINLIFKNVSRSGRLQCEPISRK